MSQGIYVHDLNGITIAADATQDVWSIMAPTRRIKLLSFELYSDAVALDIVFLSLTRITDHGSIGALGGGEDPVDPSNDPATATVRVGDTTRADATGVEQIASWTFDGIEPIIYDPKKAAPIATVAFGFSLRWLTATAAVISGQIVWEELDDVVAARYA